VRFAGEWLGNKSPTQRPIATKSGAGAEPFPTIYAVSTKKRRKLPRVKQKELPSPPPLFQIQKCRVDGPKTFVNWNAVENKAVFNKPQQNISKYTRLILSLHEGHYRASSIPYTGLSFIHKKCIKWLNNYEITPFEHYGVFGTKRQSKLWKQARVLDYKRLTRRGLSLPNCELVLNSRIRLL
jgi:hypothetical protein